MYAKKHHVLRNMKLVDLLKEWMEVAGGDEPCRLDHHGSCQAHFLEDGDLCLVKRTKAALKPAPPSGQKGDKDA